MFKALSSTTRINMIKILAKKEMHISGLARELNISVPVAAKHAKILEKSGLIERKQFGKTHVLQLKKEKLYDTLDFFSESHTVEVSKGSNILDALKAISGIEVRNVKGNEFVTSIDGEEGYYIYEVDGKIPNVSMDKYELRNDVEMKLKKLVPITGKKITIKMRSEK